MVMALPSYWPWFRTNLDVEDSFSIYRWLSLAQGLPETCSLKCFYYSTC